MDVELAVATGVAVTILSLALAIPPEDTLAVGVAATKLSAKPPAEEAHAFTLAGRALYQAGIVPAAISLVMEERESELKISSYQDAGTAVARTVMMELGMGGIVMMRS